MSGYRAFVLYEDESAKGAVPNFGPHLFVRALVADVLGGSHWDYKDLVDGNPKRGKEKLLKACTDVALIAPRGQKVFALFDDDRVREIPTLKLAPDAPPEAVTEAIVRHAGDSPQLEVVLLPRNLETVLEAIAACVPETEPSLIEQARRKDLNARDRLFVRLCEAHERAARDCVTAKVPALAVLRDRIAQALAA